MTTPNIEELFSFPCPFTIKIMGKNVSELIPEICAIISLHAEGFNPEQDIKVKQSAKGNYLAVDATITALSKAQLDKIYLALNNHALVKITL